MKVLRFLASKPAQLFVAGWLAQLALSNAAEGKWVWVVVDASLVAMTLWTLPRECTCQPKGVAQ